MTAALDSAGAGGLLRDWRRHRHLSQLDLSLTAQISARHLSFVETGRSTPSRELILHLAETLEIPLRDRNPLLLAAGYAPAYPQTSLAAEEMAPVRAALDKIVSGHQPFPAIVVNRRWEIVSANPPAIALMTAGASPDLLIAPVNVLRLSLHPAGICARIANFAQWAEHLLERLDRQIAVSAADDLVELAAELRDYPAVRALASSRRADASPQTSSIEDRLFTPLVLDHDRQRLRFFSTIATFGTALDITLAELAIESFFPADEATTEAMVNAPW